MNILITGKNGFIGAALTTFLAKTDHNVFATCRKTLDVSDEKAVDAFFKEKNVDIVLHTAIKGGRRTKKDTYFDLVENLNMFKNLFKHREQYGLMISFGSGAEANIESYYGLAKSIIAREIEGYSDNVVNLRLFGCFGPTEDDTRFIKNSINRVLEESPITIHQNKYMDFFYIEDLKKVVLHYIEQFEDSLPKTVDMCYGSEISLLDIAEKIKALTKSDISIIIEDKEEAPPYVGDATELLGLSLKLDGINWGVRETVNALRTTHNG